MSSPFALPALGLSLLAAVAVGIQLGESAVASINPVHLKGPALHPRERGVAIDEREVELARAPAPPVYGWAQGHAARAADCGDCDTFADDGGDVYSAVVPYFGDAPKAGKPAGRHEADVVRVHRGSDRNPALAKPETGRIERYAQAPLGYEEAAFAAPVADALPADGTDSFHY